MKYYGDRTVYTTAELQAAYELRSAGKLVAAIKTAQQEIADKINKLTSDARSLDNLHSSVVGQDQ